MHSLQNAIQITLACLSQEVIQNFLSNIHLLTLHCWINIFLWPILFKLRTNQPFMKWISVSLNKASHSNRNNRKIKGGRGLKLVLDQHYQHYCIKVILSSTIVQHIFPYDFMKEREVKYTKLIWGLWTVFVWSYIMVWLF